jgi:hypothetical protein
MNRLLTLRNFVLIWATSITAAMAFTATTAARWSTVPERVDNNTARIARLEESGKYQGCVLRALAEKADPKPCDYYLPSPDAYRAPSQR